MLNARGTHIVCDFTSYLLCAAVINSERLVIRATLVVVPIWALVLHTRGLIVTVATSQHLKASSK